MPDSNIFLMFILEIVLLYILALLFYYFMLLMRKIKIEDRLGIYTIYKGEDGIKVFDDIFGLGRTIIKLITKFLYKIKIFDNYSMKYQKYIKKENPDIDKMDYVSKKIIYSILFLFIVILFDVFRNQDINIFQILISLLVGFYILDIFLISESKYLTSQKENDLLRAITIMNNSFKSGHSIMQAIKLVSDELDSSLGLEFKKIYVDLSYGLSLEIAFKRFENRVNIPEVKYITTSLSILNETGGDIVKVFESVEKTFFNNKKLNDELKNLTAASRMLYYILLFIPILFVTVIYILDNSYFKAFFASPIGYMMIVICLVLYISYILIVNKIVRMGDIYD